MSCTPAPALRASWAPRPGFISTQWTVVPTGMLRSGRQLPALIGASLALISFAPASTPFGAIMLLVTATLMTHGDAAQVIAAAVFLESLDQRLVRPALVQARLHHLDYKAAAGGGRLYFNQCHRLYPSLQLRGELLRARELNVETRLQLHIRLFAVIAAPHHLAESLGLAQADHRADVLDLDAEHLLDGLFELGLIGIARHLIYELAIAIGRHRALLGDMRGQQYLQ